jgi:uncharacterized membrane protein
MLATLLPYLAAMATMVVIDSLWLGVIARPFYTGHIGHLMAATPVLPAAVVFYLLYPAGLMLFAVQPHLAGSWQQVALYSAAYGFFAYAVYDLTNHATLKNWPLAVTVTDIAWGTFLTTLMGLAAYFTATILTR